MTVKNAFWIFVFCIGTFAVHDGVVAQDYTTMDSAPAEDSAKNKDEKTVEDDKPACTKDDMVKIKKFNKKAFEVKAEAKKLADDALNVTREDEIKTKKHKKLKEDLKEANDFFQSERYQAMRPIYKRCGMRPPQIVDIPFGLPPIR